MGRRKPTYWIASLAAGALATLATGLYNSTPNGLVGAVWYGLPFTWIRELVISQQYFPWRIDAFGLIADIVVWAIVAAVVLWLAQRR